MDTDNLTEKELETKENLKKVVEQIDQDITMLQDYSISVCHNKVEKMKNGLKVFESLDIINSSKARKWLARIEEYKNEREF